MSVLVGMMVGSRTSTVDLVRDSIETILENIGDPDALIAVALAPYLPSSFTTLLRAISNANRGKLLLFPQYHGSYARFANVVIDMSREFKWTIFSHDDIRLQSQNLIPRVEKSLEGHKSPIGWISFLDTDYLTPTSWAPSIREGFHIDAVKEQAWSRRLTHQFHRLPEDWWDPTNTQAFMNTLPYDFPDKPVRCYGPFSHFIMIESDKLREAIVKCEDWSPVSLLIDEDWGLTAMKAGLSNIWIPQLKYIHVRPATGTRANGLIQQHGKFVHRQFSRKWGFPHKAIYSPTELSTIRKRFGKTMIPWAMDRRTYEWDYDI